MKSDLSSVLLAWDHKYDVMQDVFSRLTEPHRMPTVTVENPLYKPRCKEGPGTVFCQGGLDR